MHRKASSSYNFQGRSQNLKVVPQNFMEVFKVDDVTANDVMQKKQHLIRKENLQIIHSNHYCLISIFSIKLLKRPEIWFSFLREWLLNFNTFQIEICMTTSPYDLRINRTASDMRVCQHCCIIFDKKFTTHFQPTFTFSKFEQ